MKPKTITVLTLKCMQKSLKMCKVFNYYCYCAYMVVWEHFLLCLCRLEKNLGKWKNPRRMPDRDKMTSKYDSVWLLSWPQTYFNLLHLYLFALHLTENYWGDDPSPGEACPWCSSSHHVAEVRAEPLWRLAQQDRPQWKLADTNHAHR